MRDISSASALSVLTSSRSLDLELYISLAGVILGDFIVGALLDPLGTQLLGAYVYREDRFIHSRLREGILKKRPLMQDTYIWTGG